MRRVYYPEVQRVMAEATGASKVFIFDHTLRRRVRGAADRAPARRASPRRACMWTIPRCPVRSGCATSSATRQRTCCAGACR